MRIRRDRRDGEDFSELDATETSADELRSRAMDFRDRLDELQEVVEGNVSTALSSWREPDAARDTAAEAGDDVEERWRGPRPH